MGSLSLGAAAPLNLRLVNRRTEEYSGACPFCGGDEQSDRFHVWMEQDNQRFWCRRCDAKGSLQALLNADRPFIPVIHAPAKQRQHELDPNPAHSHYYRQLYSEVALWAHTNLWEDYNPDPLNYVRQRGLSDPMIGASLIGYVLNDPTALPNHLRQVCPELLHYGEAAGLLIRRGETYLTHYNLCGRILLPYIADGQVFDLRTRAFPGKGYRSLAGGYKERGATTLFGWDMLDGAETVILTEGEFKALAVTQAFSIGQLSAPAVSHPGLSYWRNEWPAELRERGVRTVIVAYDSQPRPVRDSGLQLSTEEIWTIKHGQLLNAAGLQVRVVRLPLAPGSDKADLDDYLAQFGTHALERLISAAPLLADYHASLPTHMLQSAKLPLANAYPHHRSRPRQLPSIAQPAAAKPATLSEVRAQIPALVQEHAISGQGFLVLAHMPGAGKGSGTTAGLRAYLRDQPNPGQVVWSALRKEQISDQQGLELIPLHGRNAGNCHKFSEAQTLAGKGYGVHTSLCQRRCPHVNHCAYLRQFGQEADFFAPQPLLLATHWWHEARAVVLDEFDPARLANIITLNTSDLVAMHRTAGNAQAQAILRWLLVIVGESVSRSLRGTLLLDALDQAASAEGLSFTAALATAIAALPSEEDQARLPGLPHGATLAEYEALPPGHLARLLNQLAVEDRLRLGGQLFSSRLEICDGRLLLLLRHEHLCAQLARLDQPKILLDATVNAPLLKAIFPNTPIHIEQPALASAAKVRQLLRADWAKSTLRGARREEWYGTVAAQIRPDRPTLVVCTQACATDLRAALAKRGFSQVTVAHYGSLRGSNAYKGYDVVLAQIYHPNPEAILREGRALFAGDGPVLNEQFVLEERTLTDGAGRQWSVQVPTFADTRLAALLELRREAELVQTALRGRPLDHPEAQITLLFSLPLPGLAPTEIIDEAPTPASNGGRQAATVLRLIAGAREMIARGFIQMTVTDFVEATGIGQVTVRKHWQHLANELGLHMTQQWLYSGDRRYLSAMLVVNKPPAEPVVQPLLEKTCNVTDHADNKDLIMSVIHTAASAAEPAPEASTIPDAAAHIRLLSYFRPPRRLHWGIWRDPEAPSDLAHVDVPDG
jgi:hypothetical protein